MNDKLRLQFLGDLSLDGLYCDPQHHQGLRENLQWINKISNGTDFRILNWESQLWGDENV